MRQRLKSWWQFVWARKVWLLPWALYKIIEDWGLDELREYMSSKTGGIVDWIQANVHYLPVVTWSLLPLIIIVLIVKAFLESRKLRLVTSAPTETATPALEGIAGASVQPNVVLSACFVERVYLSPDRESVIGHLDIAFAEFRNDPQSRLKDATANRLNATISYFDTDKRTPLIDRNIVGLWRQMPIPEKVVIDFNTGLMAYPDYHYISDEINLLYKGTPMGLFIIVKHKDDKDCYAVDSKHFFIKTPSYKISEPEIHVKVKLTGQRVDEEYWLILQNTKKSIKISQDIN